MVLSFHVDSVLGQGINTLPIHNMVVNQLETCDHILFSANSYNIFASLSSKYIENKQRL